MKQLLILFCSIFLFSCDFGEAEESLKSAELECSNKKSVENIDIWFYGYTTLDADSLLILQKRSGKLIDSFIVKIPSKIVDSLRHKRELSIKKEVLLSDTLILILNEEHKVVYNYQYKVNNHNSMFEERYGCDLMNVTVDGKLESSVISFFKKGYNMDSITLLNYRQYYKEKNNSH